MTDYNDSLLIIHQGALGDILLTLPAVLGLRKRHRAIDILCQDGIGRLVCALKATDRHLPLEAASFASLYSDPPEGKKKDDRAAQVLSSYTRIILFSNSEPLEKRLKAATRKPVHRVRPRPEPGDGAHVAEHLIRSLAREGLLDLGGPENRAHPPLLWRGRGPAPPSEPNTVIIHPGSGSKRKCWPLSNFITVARRLGSNGLRPEFILGPAEYELKAPLLALGKGTGRVLCFSDLVELLARLNSVGGFIGNDSGVAHLAALINLPTVAVFGPSDPKRWHPVGKAVAVVRPELTHPPCFETEPACCDAPDCLALTTPEQVLEAMGRVLRGCGLPEPRRRPG